MLQRHLCLPCYQICCLDYRLSTDPYLFKLQPPLPALGGPTILRTRQNMEAMQELVVWKVLGETMVSLSKANHGAKSSNPCIQNPKISHQALHLEPALSHSFAATSLNGCRCTILPMVVDKLNEARFIHDHAAVQSSFGQSFSACTS